MRRKTRTLSYLSYSWEATQFSEEVEILVTALNKEIKIISVAI